jgi:pyruvate-ferredoxin/flavodoxin oxidoreductase
MSKSQPQSKEAVEAGYWSLYRYNPQLEEEGKNPFSLDSKAPSKDLREFMMSEVRFSSLYKVSPEAADELFGKAQADAKFRYDRYVELAKR